MIIVDCIYENMMSSVYAEKLATLSKLKRITKETLKSDKKYRTLYLNQPSFMHMENTMPGCREYLRGIGFSEGFVDNALYLLKVDQNIIHVALSALTLKIDLLKGYQYLNDKWQLITTLMKQNDAFKNHGKWMAKMQKYDFVNNYKDYYVFLTMVYVSVLNVSSQDPLIKQVMTAHGFTVEKSMYSDINIALYTYLQQMNNKIKEMEGLRKATLGMPQKFHKYSSSLTIEKLYNYLYVDNIDESADHDEKMFDDELCEDQNLEEYEGISMKYALSCDDVQHRKNKGIQRFQNILSIESDKYKYHHLLSPSNWDDLIHAMQLNLNKLSVHQQISSLNELKTIVQRACDGKNKYRTIHLNTANFINKFAFLNGCIEFFKGVGYREDLKQGQMINLEPDRLLIDVAVGSISHMIKLLKHLHSLQRVFCKMIRLLINWEPFKTEREKLYAICGRDFVNNYNDYYELLTQISNISQMDLNINAVDPDMDNVRNDNIKSQITIHLLQKYNVKCGILNHANKTSLTICNTAFTLYRKVEEIEKFKKQRAFNVESTAPIQVRWKHIANAISHELYDELSKALMVIITKHDIPDVEIYNQERVQEILQRLNGADVSLGETQYLKRLIERAINANSLSKKGGT